MDLIGLGSVCLIPPPRTLTRSVSGGSTCSRGCGASWASTQTPSPGSQEPCRSPARIITAQDMLAYWSSAYLAFEALGMKVPVKSPDPRRLGLTLFRHDGLGTHRAFECKYPEKQSSECHPERHPKRHPPGQ